MKGRMKRLKIYTPFFIFLILLSACGAGAPEPGLEGTAWELVKLNEQLPLADTTIMLTFDDGQAGGNSGCNSYGAAYEVDGDSLRLGELMSTMMYCRAEGVMDQETTYLLYLSQVRTYAIIDGELYLSLADGSQLEFIPQK